MEKLFEIIYYPKESLGMLFALWLVILLAFVIKLGEKIIETNTMIEYIANCICVVIGMIHLFVILANVSGYIFSLFEKAF